LRQLSSNSCQLLFSDCRYAATAYRGFGIGDLAFQTVDDVLSFKFGNESMLSRRAAGQKRPQHYCNCRRYPYAIDSARRRYCYSLMQKYIPWGVARILHWGTEAERRMRENLYAEEGVDWEVVSPSLSN